MRGRSSLVKGHEGMNNCTGRRVQFPVTLKHMSILRIHWGLGFTAHWDPWTWNPPSPSRNPVQTKTQDFFCESVTGRLVYLISVHLRIPGYLEITRLKKTKTRVFHWIGTFIVSFVVASCGSEGQLQYVFAWILGFTYQLKNTILNDEKNLKIMSNTVYWSICLCLYFYTEREYISV